MRETNIPLNDLLARLHKLAESALSLWDLPERSRVRLINVSENVTYLIEAPGGEKAVLRVHRAGYHSRRAIECELAWIDALGGESQLRTAGYIPGRNGDPIQRAGLKGVIDPRYMVLFQFVEGVAPDGSGDPAAGFRALGAIAARCHSHALGWRRPENFERLTWDETAVFGPKATWGNWRDAPNVTTAIRDLLEEVEAGICARLAAYGKGPDRFNLIHADMRFANLLRSAEGTCLIDFDDCGFGWLMYDFAAAVSFIEDHPRLPEMQAAWLEGYRAVRPLPDADAAEIGTMIMLRRMALLAWIGSHIEAPEPQALAPDFAATTARLGRAWLEGLG